MTESTSPPPPRPKYKWPWILLAVIIVGVTVAVLWIAAIAVQVRGMRENREFSPLPAVPASPTAPTNAVTPATNAPIRPAPTAAAPASNSLQPSTTDPLAGFREALQGGDATAGRKVFFDKPEANCAKCHRVGGQGGDLGPVLDDIGLRQSREYILTSVLKPNAHTVKGYESLIVLLKDGGGCAGILKSENETQLVLNTPDQGPVTIRKSDVQSRQAGLSPMPEGLGQLLSKQELANLVEFLAGLKKQP